MPRPKEGKSRDSSPTHYSVGAIIKMGERYLLVDRANYPFGFAGITGHVNQGENETQAIKQTVKNDSGLKVERLRLIYEEELPWSQCSSGFKGHHWFLFECIVSGIEKENRKELKMMGWYSKEQIQKLKLAPTWEYWFEKMGILEPHN